MDNITGRRVLYVEQRSSLAGSRFSLLSIVKGVRDYGIVPLVVCGGDGPFVRELRKANISVETIDISSLFSISPRRITTNLLSLIRLWRYTMKMHVDLIHSNSFGAHIFAGIVAGLLGKKTVWHIREFTENIEDTPQKKRWRKLIVSVLLLGATFLADRIICVSEAIRDHYANGWISRKMKVIHNGIDLSEFDNNKRTDYLLEELGLCGEDKVVSIFARLTPWKGHRLFIEGAAQIKQQMERVKFLVVGSQLDYEIGENYEEQLRNLVRDLKLDGDVIFTGFRRDVPNLMALSDVIVSTSNKEPFGRVMLEAGAMARPVVASNSGGHPEIVIDGVTGYLVPPDDVEILASKILTLLRDGERAKELGKNARERVEAQFALEGMIKKLLKVYAELLGGCDYP
ncbi:MAG TPA: glycosyltransferase family 1 protein [Anaerolineae bacterium]|nr:glycosyltransferase family 1 protein [Anaerolineae bacterium]